MESEIEKLGQLFDSQIDLNKKAHAEKISVKNFKKKVTELSNDIKVIEDSTHSEPEERAEQAKLILPKIKALKEKMLSADNFSHLTEHDGLATLQHELSPIFLSLEARASALINAISSLDSISPLSDPKKSKTAAHGMTLLSQHFKVKKAYHDIYTGRKYKKAGLVENKKINPIKLSSQENLKKLKRKLLQVLDAEIKANRIDESFRNQFGLKPDETDLFAALLNLPFKLQHATNHFSEVANAGRLDSLKEIHRHNADYESPFTTKGNLTELGNGGFVCSRFYVDGVNGEETRYGNTRIISDLSVLRDIGWVSLHDQLVPFSNQRRKQSMYVGKRLLFQGEPASINNKAKANKSGDAIKYTYRESLISNYENGTKDTQKSFGKSIKVFSETISFTEEIFYGNDILPGIALSVIYRLRQLDACGYRLKFLKNFNKLTSLGKTTLLGNLIKDFYRIEGKYPVSLPLQYNKMTQHCFFKPFAGSDPSRSHNDRRIVVENPDGDGRLNIDLSMNSENARLGYYSERLKYATDRISVLQKFPDNPAYQEELATCIKQKEELNAYLQEFEETKQEYLMTIGEVITSDYTRALCKRSYEYIKLVSETLVSFIEEGTISFEDVIPLSLNKITLMTHEIWLQLLESGDISWIQLKNLKDKELEEMPEFDLLSEINEKGHSFEDLLKFYRKDFLTFECATCDDLTELAAQYYPDIPQEILVYSDETGEEIDYDSLYNDLSETEKMLFDMNREDGSEQSEYSEEEWNDSDGSERSFNP